MSKLILSMPKGISQLDQMELHQLTHPKGKTYTYIRNENDLYEINHFDEKYHSCFVTIDNETKVESPALLQVTRMDVFYLFIPILENTIDKGKVSLDDLELPDVLRTIMQSWKDPKVFFNKFCDSTENGGKLYVKLSYEKMVDELVRRHQQVLQVMEKRGHLADKGKDAKEYYAALIFYDYLSKPNAIKFLMKLGIDIEQQKEPPTKKKKDNSGNAVEPTDDYTNGKENIGIITSPKLTKKEKQLKSASQGSRKLTSFFTPKKK